MYTIKTTKKRYSVKGKIVVFHTNAEIEHTFRLEVIFLVSLVKSQSFD